MFQAIRYDLSYDSQIHPAALQDHNSGLAPGDPNYWDGWYRLLSPQGALPSGLVPQAVRLLRKYGIEPEVLDRREEPLENIPLMSRHMPEPRPYQAKAVEAALQAGRGVIDAPPRSGKTCMGAMLVDKLAQPTIWIAPTKAIVRQTTAALERFLGGAPVVQLLGDGSMAQKRSARLTAFDALVVVTTEATAVRLPVAFWKTRRCLIYDEFHHSSSDRGQKINRLAEACYWRFGLTGTHFRSDANTEVRMHAVLSHVVEKIHVQDLVDAGYLCPADVFFIPIEEPRFRGTVQEMYDPAIVEHPTRNGWVRWAAEQLTTAGRQVIVLINRIAHGALLEQLIPGSVFVHGQLKKTKGSDPVHDAIGAFNAGKIHTLIGTTVLGEGIDLPAADALIYAKAGRAKVTVTQDVYRVLTAHPEKGRAIIVEFADRGCRPFLEQSVARARLYAQEESWTVRALENPLELAQHL